MRRILNAYDGHTADKVANTMAVAVLGRGQWPTRGKALNSKLCLGTELKPGFVRDVEKPEGQIRVLRRHSTQQVSQSVENAEPFPCQVHKNMAEENFDKIREKWGWKSIGNTKLVTPQRVLGSHQE